MEARTIRGIGVSPGLAMARAMVVRLSLPSVPDRTVPADQVDREIERLGDAVVAVCRHLDDLRQKTFERAGPEAAGIFDAQRMMAQDEVFLESVRTLIRNNNLSAETAYEFKALELRNLWQNSGMSLLRDRLSDLHSIQLGMLAQLVDGGRDESWIGRIDGQVIVVAQELAPGLTVQLDRDHVAGLVSEEGTRTSHAAILAHSLGIPAVMGAHGALDRIEDGAVILLDGQAGTIVVDPGPDELEYARVQSTRRAKFEMQLDGLVDQPAETPDGTRVTLVANIDLPDEVETAVRSGAEGVGLLRTEFLVTGRATLPTEDEQTEYFRRVGAAFGGRRVVIRSYDLGGDKFPVAFNAPHEANPFLGWRSIRVCLDQPEIFRPQIRALLRAAVDRDIRLMLPMVISPDEVAATRDMVAEEAAALADAGVRAAAELGIGVMIETPAAVEMVDELAAISAFLSVGSNDLTQYTLAVDRGNARLASRFESCHPAVVRQLARVAAAGNRAGIPVSVCGEMASDPIAALLLVGLGFHKLSVAPPSIPLIKFVIRSVPAAVAGAAARAALDAKLPAEVRTLVRDLVAPHIDLRLVDPGSALPRMSAGTSLPLGY